MPTREVEKRLVTSSLQQELSRNYDRGVCCFSTAWKNPLLWSHYGDKHRGICIGYDLNRKPRPMPQKVIYGQNRMIKTSTLFDAVVKGNQNTHSELDRDVLLRKAPGWRYEREWRLIDKVGVQPSPLRLRNITFGLRCPISVQHAVVSALQKRDGSVDFFTIYNVPGSYRLDRNHYNTSEEVEPFHPVTAASPQEDFGGDR